ncbi:Scw4p [Sugiyamaella lignohabitans]|uniref:Scw4p n=1 Tax=Sugiyamaella lignohabitans TaxID=796027 RepID=A0A167FBK5_9ASCO|nr:Scw4p [Sugiyamaella lignohabitans]ANB15075.1 Scw4p [Sugiyamaella lignohabitans]
MKYSAILSLATAISGALAQPIQHGHHQHKREPVVEYETVQVTHYVTANAAAATAVVSAANDLATAVVNPVVAAAANSAYSAPAPQAPPPAATSFATVAAASSPAAPAPAPAESSSSSAAAAAPSSGSGSSSPSGSAGSAGALGISYSPYTNSGGCKSASQVAADLAELTGYNVIRIYGVDCNQVANVYAALAPGQKLFAGVYDIGNVAGDLGTIKDGINNDWSVIHTISIGNELVNGGQATPAQVGSLVGQARGILQSYGYTGPVVAVDTFIAVINNPELCQYSDYMAVNAHAFFDGGVTASQAGQWALLQIQRVYSACNGAKSVLISESGWPSQGDSNGVAVPSSENLQTAVSALKSSVGNDCIVFNAFNDLWKAPGYLNVEQYWGIYGNGN